MEWFKKHVDSVMVISVVVGSVVWQNKEMNARFNELEKEMAVMKTVLIMKGIMPDALAQENAGK